MLSERKPPKPTSMLLLSSRSSKRSIKPTLASLLSYPLLSIQLPACHMLLDVSYLSRRVITMRFKQVKILLLETPVGLLRFSDSTVHLDCVQYS